MIRTPDQTQLFKFKDNVVRALTIEGEPYFVGKDVAEILGYSNTRDALSIHVDIEDKNTVAIHDGNKGNPNQTVISESGLYSLILSSKLPTAKEFKRWVTSEVLPSIRKHGAYMTGATIESLLANPENGAKLLMTLSAERQARLAAEEQVEVMTPKALFADSVSASHNAILVGDLAKILSGNGVNIGANRLFKWLRVNGYLISGNRTDRNMPTQKSMELGLFQIKETVINHSDGHTSISKTSKVTGKGQQYFINKFLA